MSSIGARRSHPIDLRKARFLHRLMASDDSWGRLALQKPEHLARMESIDRGAIG